MKPLDRETLFVDTWFMSCRVLKRGMENFTLNIMVEKARTAGYKKIIGEYIPTSKNSIVKDHYKDLGFSSICDSNSMQYYLELASYKERECYIKQQ